MDQEMEFDVGGLGMFATSVIQDKNGSDLAAELYQYTEVVFCAMPMMYWISKLPSKQFPDTPLQSEVLNPM
jgi:hypothetical protein